MFHVEITTVGGEKFVYSNCTYNYGKTGIEIQTSERLTVFFQGNYTAKIISMNDYETIK